MSVNDNRKIDQRAKGIGKTSSNNGSRKLQGGGHTHNHGHHIPKPNTSGTYNSTRAALFHSHEIDTSLDPYNTGPPDWSPYGNNAFMTNIDSIGGNSGPHTHHAQKQAMRRSGGKVNRKKFHFGGFPFEYHQHDCSFWNGFNDWYGMNMNQNLCNLAGYEASLYNPEPNPVAGCTEPPCCSYNPETLICESIFTSGVMPGDTTGDGQLDVNDIIRIVGHILGDYQLVGEQLQAADYNNDGLVNVLDAMDMVEVILEMMPTTSSAQHNQLRRALAPLGIQLPVAGRTTRGRRIGNQRQSGGLLKGPSHQQGGIPARVMNNGGEIELEGGEYIINAQTVNAVGTEFLDQLNSTQTSYHQGGFSQGQLPSPSQYSNGGKVVNRVNRGVPNMTNPRNTRRTQRSNTNMSRRRQRRTRY